MKKQFEIGELVKVSLPHYGKILPTGSGLPITSFWTCIPEDEAKYRLDPYDRSVQWFEIKQSTVGIYMGKMKNNNDDKFPDVKILFQKVSVVPLDYLIRAQNNDTQ